MMLSTHFRMTGRRPGQGLVEFALIAPILFLLVIGMVELARAWNLKQSLTDAAREAVRTAVISSASNPISDDSVYAIVDNAIIAAGFDPDVDVTTLSAYPWPAAGSPLTVSIQYDYVPYIMYGLVFWTTGQTYITLRTSSTMRKE
jgi:Flp pilus assembly protein TadG